MIVFRKKMDVKGHWLLLLGLALMGWSGQYLVLGKLSEQWPAVEGRLLISRVERHLEDLVPRVEYEYTVAGTRYLGRRFSFKDKTILFRMDFEEDYPEGETVPVYVRPGHPEVSVLERGYSAKYFWFTLAGAALFFGALGIYAYEYFTGKSVEIG
jgi:hypothetical protein